MDNTIQNLNNSQTNNTELNAKLDKISSSLDNIKSTLSDNNNNNSITPITDQLKLLNGKINDKLVATNIGEFDALKDLKISSGLLDVSNVDMKYEPSNFLNKKIFDYDDSTNKFNTEFFTNILNVLAYHERIFQDNDYHIKQ